METLVKNSANVATIYEAFGRGDVPFIIEQLDKNVLWEVMGAKPNAIAGTYSGASNVPSFFSALANNYQLENFQVEYILDADDDTVIAKGYHEGSGRVSGKPLKTHWAMEWKFNDDGKVIEYRNMYDTQAYANAL
jgi:ketosteroid isomerase-like protein